MNKLINIYEPLCASKHNDEKMMNSVQNIDPL